MAPFDKNVRRGHKTLSLKQKCDILDKLSKGVSGKQLAEDYGVGTSTISDIKKQREKIQRFLTTAETLPDKRKNLRTGEYPDMEEILQCWFFEQRRKYLPISKSLLCEKATQIVKHLYGEGIGFRASNGWYDKFRKRFGIRHVKICGEKLSCASELIKPFQKRLHDKIKQLQLVPNQIYNADESALFWKILPEKTLVHTSEKTAPGRKTSKERVTFLACANASGCHRLKLLMIGKSRNPRSFKNAELPVEYRSSKNAWMTTRLFREWFHTSFVPQVKSFLANNNLPLKALLLVDNARCHGATEADLISNNGNILTMFLPPNCTALIQPMDQNPIRLCKLQYKKSLLSHIIATSTETDLVNCLKKISLKDAALYLSSAWDSVKQEHLAKSWQKLLNSNSEESDSEWSTDDEVPLVQLIRQEEDLRHMQNLLNQISTCDLSTRDVNDWIMERDIADFEEDGEDEEEREDTENHPAETEKIRHELGFESLNTSLQWAEENNASFSQIMALRQMREKALWLIQQKKKNKAN